MNDTAKISCLINQKYSITEQKANGHVHVTQKYRNVLSLNKQKKFTKFIPDPAAISIAFE
jgi:hypothetical protein